MDRDELQRRANAPRWYHTIDRKGRNTVAAAFRQDRAVFHAYEA